MTINKIKTVENYIQSILMKSITFTLIKKDDLVIDPKPNKGYNKSRYYEKDKDSNNKDIIHLPYLKL